MTDKDFMTDEQADRILAEDAAIKAGHYTVNELADAEEAGQQITLREMLERLGDLKTAELLTPSNRERVKEGMKSFNASIRDFLASPSWKAIQEQAQVLTKRMAELEPFYHDVVEAYDDTAPFMSGPIGGITNAIDIYTYDRGLEGATQEQKEPHRKPFLAFFAAYLEEWEAIKAPPEGLTEDELLIAWQRLKERGIITKELPEEALEAAQEEALQTAEILGEYSKILQVPALLTLATINQRHNPVTLDDLTKQARASGKGITVLDDRKPDKQETDEEIIAAFETRLKKVNNMTALKLLDLYRMDQANNRPYGNPDTNFNLDIVDFMKQCGIPNTPASYKRTLRNLTEVGRAWYEISLDLDDGDTRQSLRMLQEKAESRSGKFTFRFTERLAGYLVKSFIGYYHPSLLKMDERNPNAFFMGSKLQLHYSILSNHQKGTANIISVKALTEELETKGTLPSYEEVKAGARQYSQRIIKPFEAALNSIDFLETWEYCNAKKKPLTKKQKTNFTYATFIDCYITFTLRDAPDLTEAVQNKAKKDAEREAKAAARKAKREKKDTVT